MLPRQVGSGRGRCGQAAPAGIARPSALMARAPAPEPAKVFPKLSLHQRPSSRIVLLRTGA